jgi:hypothetical protein
MRGNLPVPPHRAALRAALLSFPLFGLTENLSSPRTESMEHVG